MTASAGTVSERAIPREPTLKSGRLGPRDILRIATSGLLSRRLRSALTALGIAIGIAVMLAVLGIAESSRATLLAELDRIGSNLLTVSAGQTFLGADSALPQEATSMIDRIGPVDSATSVSQTSATVRRTDQIDPAETGGIAVQAADTDLLESLGGTLAAGRFLDDAVDGYPAVVLGSVAAERLGIASLEQPVLVWIADRWWSVVGIMDSLPLAPELDRSALVGRDAAAALLDSDGAPDDDLRPRGTRPARRRAGRPAGDGGPGASRGDQRQPALRRHRSAGRGGLGLHDPLPGTRRGGRARRGARHRQRDADGRARAAERDRPAPSPRGDPRPHRRPVPRGSGAAGRRRRCRRGAPGLASWPRPTRSARAGSSPCRSPEWSAGSWRPRWSARWPGSIRPFAPRTRHRRTRCEPEPGRRQPSRR